MFENSQKYFHYYQTIRTVVAGKVLFLLSYLKYNFEVFAKAILLQFISVSFKQKTILI